jgi:hypothetical protein
LPIIIGGRYSMNLPAACCGVSLERGSYPPHPALSPGGARESSNPAESSRESFGWNPDYFNYIKHLYTAKLRGIREIRTWKDMFSV